MTSEGGVSIIVCEEVFHEGCGRFIKIQGNEFQRCVDCSKYINNKLMLNLPETQQILPFQIKLNIINLVGAHLTTFLNDREGICHTDQWDQRRDKW